MTLDLILNDNGPTGKALYSQVVKSVFGSSLLAYWTLGDAVGSGSAADLSGNGYHGVPSGVTFGQTGIGDGKTSAYLPGTLSSINLWSPELFKANTLDNAGFETSGAGGDDVFAAWTEAKTDGSVADEGTLVHSGAHAAKLVAGVNRTTNISQNALVTPGEQYTLSFWTRGDGTYAGRYAINDVTHSTVLLGYTSTGVTGTTYTQISYTFTIPAECTTVQIIFRCPGTNTGAFYVDDVSLQIVSTQPAFTPSSFTMLVWGKLPVAEWMTGVTGYLYRIKTSADDGHYNAAVLAKNTTNNELVWQYIDDTYNYSWTATLGSTSWFCMGLTCDATANFVIPYLNGVAIDTGDPVGVWTDPYTQARCIIGAESTVMNQSLWTGNVAHAILTSRAATASEMLRLSRNY